ncbi:MAG: response regulator [Deltaproteobacteria bacterium]|nr:response regulator [Deltaproteobacteria bacterium]
MDASFKDTDSEELPLVVVTEGNADEMCLISRVLGEKDYRVLGYSDCDKAYNLIKRECPVLAIIDVSLCHISGSDLIKKIRSGEIQGSMPVIAIVASSSEKDFAGGGADAFLKRPFNEEILKQTVESLLKEK